MKIIVLGLLTSWVLMMPDVRGTFGSAASCEAAIVGFQAQARDGAKWVAQQRQAAQQDDPAHTLFWRRSVRMAEEQVARARGAHCVERSDRS